MASGIKTWTLGLLAAVAALANPAAAQKYDGGGVIKFGVFGQGTFLNYDQAQPFAATVSPGGIAGGVSIGYDHSIHQRWMLGVEVDTSLGDIRGKTNGVGAVAINNIPVGAVPLSPSYGFDYLATVRGRLGYYVHPGWLLYGTAGAAFLGYEIQGPATLPGPATVSLKASDTAVGWAAGVGTEVAWHHVLLTAEYLYAGFGSRDVNVVNPAAGVSSTFNVTPDVHAVRLGIKFKIGHDYDHDIGSFYSPMK